MNTDRVLRAQSAVMVGLDGALAAGALLAPDRTLRLLGHRKASEDAIWLFRRCAPIWATFAAGHAVAVTRGQERDWWALSWLRATELATELIWSRSPAFTNRGHRAMLVGTGAANLAMTIAYAARSRTTAPRTKAPTSGA
ncbi:MAG: hypothetical protein M3550_01930 [Actinomycetota bacterium]|nr:hypothetical protein [Actinomycetota bacterium]